MMTDLQLILGTFSAAGLLVLLGTLAGEIEAHKARKERDDR